MIVGRVIKRPGLSTSPFSLKPRDILDAVYAHGTLALTKLDPEKPLYIECNV